MYNQQKAYFILLQSLMMMDFKLFALFKVLFYPLIIRFEDLLIMLLIFFENDLLSLDLN
jgi:hypothetical protein